MRIPRRHGFTLVELLTVIAIIGILTAIVIPVVSNVRATARRSACTSNLRQIGVAIHLFVQDNRGLLPVATDFGTDPFGIKGAGNAGWYGWTHYTHPYVGKIDANKSNLYCPDILNTIPVTDSYANYTGYGYNKYLGKVSNGVATLKRLAEIPQPARTPMLWEDVQYEAGSTNNPYGGAPSLRFNGGGEYRFAFRHGDNANLLMVSGAVVPFPRRANNRATDYPEFNWDF